MELYELYSPRFKLTPQFVVLAVLGVLTIGVAGLTLRLKQQGKLDQVAQTLLQTFRTPIERVVLNSEYSNYQLRLEYSANLDRLLQQRLKFSLKNQEPAETGNFRQLKIVLTDTPQTKFVTNWTDGQDNLTHSISTDYELSDETLILKIYLSPAALEKFPERRNDFLNEKILTIICQASTEISGGRVSATDICMDDHSYFTFTDTVVIEESDLAEE